VRAAAAQDKEAQERREADSRWVTSTFSYAAQPTVWEPPAPGKRRDFRNSSPPLPIGESSMVDQLAAARKAKGRKQQASPPRYLLRYSEGNSYNSIDDQQPKLRSLTIIRTAAQDEVHLLLRAAGYPRQCQDSHPIEES